MKKIATLVFTVLVLGTHAQKVFGPTPKNMKSDRAFSALAEGAFFFEGFENAQIGSLPLGWTSSTNDTVGFVTGSAGDSPGQTNENGYWPVPEHGVFAMTNDDVCNCDKSADYLVSKVIPLEGLKNIKIGFSSFIASNTNENASLEFTADGVQWKHFLDLPISNQWTETEIIIPDSFLTNSFQFRFHYTDQGNYASGLAVDDIYLRSSQKSSPEIEAVYAFDQNDIYSESLYESVPLSIARDWEFDFGIKINYEGSEIQKVKTEFFATDASDDTSAIQTLSPFTSAIYSTNIATDLYPSELKTYNTFYRLLDAENDSVLTPIKLKRFVVSDSTYSRINYVNDGFGISLQSNITELGTTFHLQDDSVKAVRIQLHSTTEAGSKAVIHFHNLISGITEFSTDTFTISANDITSGLKRNVNQGFNESVYLVSIEKISGNISLATTANKSANHNEVLSKDSIGFKPFSYFPFITLNIPTSNCAGDIKPLVNNISCHNQADGTIEILHAGFNGNASFNWSTGATNGIIENLSAGTYSVTVSDTNGCDYVDSIELANPQSISFNPDISGERCNQHDARISLNTSGGTKPYQFWIDSIACDETISSLATGNFLVEMIDANGCTFSESMLVGGSDTLVVDVTTIAPNCDSSNGSIQTLITGTSPFNFDWNTGANTSTLENLSSGIYTVTVTDSVGCENVQTIELNNDLGAVIEESNHTDNSCYGDENGAIDLTLFGGTSPFIFHWNDGATSEDRTNLSSSAYQVTVTDNANCKSFFHTTIHSNSSPILADLDAKGIFCSSDLGRARVLALDTSLSMAWETGDLVKEIDSLHAGFYAVTLTNSSGCNWIDSILIDSITALKLSIDSLDFDQDSTGYYGASIFIEVSGGSPNYSYLWNTGDYSKNLTTSDTGVFTLTVTDQFSCKSSISKYLSGNPQLVETILSNTELTVFPNPTSEDAIQIKSNKNIYLSEVYNINGVKLKTVYSDHLKTLQTLNVVDLPSGIYLIKTQHDDQSVVSSSFVRLNK